MSEAERLACAARPVQADRFNPAVELPYGLTTAHILAAMTEYVEFLTFINGQLHGKGLQRLEAMLMPANFSSMVGELVIAALPKHCPGLVRNQHHNGHPDLLPANRYPRDGAQYAPEGIEIKGSRYDRGWQGHNEEACWLMVFVFDSNRPVDAGRGVAPRPFRFHAVYAAKLEKADWKFSPRNGESRRTITAAVTAEGCRRMKANWVYADPPATRPRRTASGRPAG